VFTVESSRQLVDALFPPTPFPANRQTVAQLMLSVPMVRYWDRADGIAIRSVPGILFQS
jgi:hypothetical protein